MKCLLRYPGGKSRMVKDLAPYLARMLDGEGHYSEPFVGGGSVALYVARLSDNVQLHLNDKDPLIAALWRVICGPTACVEALADRLRITPTLDLWHRVREHKPLGDISQAFKAIFLNRTSWNGIIHEVRPIGGLGQKSAWTVGCRYNAESLIELIREYHALMAGRTKVLCLDAADFMQKRPFPCYVDPPYLMNGKNVLYGATMSHAQHQQFAQVLLSLRKFTLTYDMKDRIACDLYWGTDKSLIDTRYSMDTAHRAHRADVQVAEWKRASEICAWKGYSMA